MLEASPWLNSYWQAVPRAARKSLGTVGVAQYATKKSQSVNSIEAANGLIRFEQTAFNAIVLKSELSMQRIEANIRGHAYLRYFAIMASLKPSMTICFMLNAGAARVVVIRLRILGERMWITVTGAIWSERFFAKAATGLWAELRMRLIARACWRNTYKHGDSVRKTRLSDGIRSPSVRYW